MKFNKLAMISSFLCVAALSHADPSQWKSGVEYFSWREYVTSCPQALVESGPRAFVRYDDTGPTKSDWQIAWHAKAYVGLVNYDGFTQSCTPLNASTSYFGTNGEASATRWLPAMSTASWPRIGIDGGVGVDVWRRGLLASGGYNEDYAIGYARLGLAAKRSSRWTVHAGIKEPFASYELAHLGAAGFSSDAALRPKGELSYFANLEYRFSPNMDVTFYYDSYRFNASNSVTISSCPPSNTACSVHQPKSLEDTIGLFAHLDL